MGAIDLNCFPAILRLRESWTSGECALTTNSSNWLAEFYRGRRSSREPDRYKSLMILQLSFFLVLKIHLFRVRFHDSSTSSTPERQTGSRRVGACLWPTLRPWKTGCCFTPLGTAAKLRPSSDPSTRSRVHWVLPFRSRPCESKPGVANLFEPVSYFMATESHERSIVC